MIIYIVYCFHWRKFDGEAKLDSAWRTSKQAQEYIQNKNNEITKFPRNYSYYIETVKLED